MTKNELKTLIEHENFFLEVRGNLYEYIGKVEGYFCFQDVSSDFYIKENEERLLTDTYQCVYK